MHPKEPQFPQPSDDRPEGWDHLTPETMDEMSQHYSKEDKKKDK
jgi:hypothetical protein